MKESLKSFQVNYGLHDVVYLRRQESGDPGWNTAEDLADNMEQLTTLFSRSDIPKKGRILDVGCGAGDISFWLESLGYEVEGIDVSTVAIEWAKSKAGLNHSSAKFSVVNVAQNPYVAEKPFDLVLDNHCLHCIIGVDRKQYLRNIYDNLVLGGYYICNTMCGDNIPTEQLPFYDIESRCIIRNQIALRYIGMPDDIMQEIKEAGFEIEYQEIIASIEDTDSLCLTARKV